MIVNICTSTLRDSKLKSTNMNLTVLCPEQKVHIGFTSESLHGPQGQKSHDYSSGKIVYKGLAEAV